MLHCLDERILSLVESLKESVSQPRLAQGSKGLSMYLMNHRSDSILVTMKCSSRISSVLLPLGIALSWSSTMKTSCRRADISLTSVPRQECIEERLYLREHMLISSRIKNQKPVCTSQEKNRSYENTS